MQKVITFGVFDFFHIGHLNLFENIKKIVPDAYLIVAVQNTQFILKYKPHAHIFYSLEDRIKIISNLKCVDEVIVYDDVFDTITTCDFDIWAKGPDQCHASFQKSVEYCNAKNKEIITIDRTKGVSSSEIKHEIIARE